MSDPTLPVFISGLGCVSPLGLGLEENDAGLRASRDAVTHVGLFDTGKCQSTTAGQLPDGLGARAAAIHRPARRWSRAAQAVLCALAEAREANPGFEPDCVVMGTTSGGMALGEAFFRALRADRDLDSVVRRLTGYVPQEPVQQAMRVFGITAPVRIVSNACASGTTALGLGALLVRSGLARSVLAGGYDVLSELVFAGFDALRASTAGKCRPFDVDRTGLSLGEGAAVFCLNAAGGNLALAGYGSAMDTHHLTQPHPSGSGPLNAMRRALADAAIMPSDLDYINAHGTGTPLNDASEGAALVALAPTTPVSSTKGMTGHALGAAGAIEAAFCCLALRGGYLPANIHFVRADLPLNIVANAIRPAAPRTALSNSFGFGGSNAAVVLRKSS